MLKPIKGYEGHYSISPDGEILSHKSRWKRNLMRELKQEATRNGYLRVQLAKNGKVTKKLVHSLVAENFIGDRPTGYQVNHIDGNKRNNHSINLEYVTPSENSKHSYQLGLSVSPNNRGERSGSAKLNATKVAKIRAELPFIQQKEIAKRYGVSRSQISKISRNLSWQ